uniref:Uncharacterized protein n=1 Tax=Magallana gigas TaxID=29159 RepID=K1QHQ7_MAGGI
MSGVLSPLMAVGPRVDSGPLTLPFYASNLRVLTTRLIRLYVLGVAVTYWLKYHSKSWEKRKGGFYFLGDGAMGLEEVGYQKSSDFADYGFKDRKVLRVES